MSSSLSSLTSTAVHQPGFRVRVLTREAEVVEKGRAQFLCSRNLVSGHARPEFVFVLAGQLISLRRSKGQPGIGEHVNLRHARAVGVQEPEVVLRNGLALLGGLAIPLRHLGSIAFRTHAPAVGEHDLTDGVDGAKGELGINVTLIDAAAVLIFSACRRAGKMASLTGGLAPTPATPMPGRSKRRTPPMGPSETARTWKT